MKQQLVLVISALLLSAEAAAAAAGEAHDAPRELQNFAVRAFMCDDEYKELKNQEPLEGAPQFRVCLKPDTNTEQQGVSILKLNNFKFYMPRDGMKTLTQAAVDAGAPSELSVLDCPGGKDQPCSFQTQLRENFYYQDGQVEGVGSVALQYNSGSGRRHLRTTATTTTTQDQDQEHRQMQEFAGIVNVNMFFDIEDGFDKKKIKEARGNFVDHWNDQPASVQGLYITGVLVLLLLLCCCLGGMILWKHCCADIPASWVRRTNEPDEIHVMPPVGVDGKATEDDDPSETYSLEEDDLMAGQDVEDEEESSEEEESQPPPSYISRQLENGNNGDSEAEDDDPSEFSESQTQVTTEHDLAVHDHDGGSSRNGNSRASSSRRGR